MYKTRTSQKRKLAVLCQSAWSRREKGKTFQYSYCVTTVNRVGCMVYYAIIMSAMERYSITPYTRYRSILSSYVCAWPSYVHAWPCMTQHEFSVALARPAVLADANHCYSTPRIRVAMVLYTTWTLTKSYDDRVTITSSRASSVLGVVRSPASL